MDAQVSSHSGRFIVLEGPDRSGKSTQAALLVKALRGRGFPVVHTREPGGTGFAEAVRQVVLDPAHKVKPLAELLLYEAARAQHTEERLRPALADGAIVVCERYTLATLAYQGAGRGLPVALVKKLNRIATGGLRADATIVLDVPDRVFHKRQTAPADRLEAAGRAFRDRVRGGYRRFAKSEPRTRVVDATLSVDQVHAAIWERVAKVLPRARR
ncbi:MAG: dTMP kinase [Elusimicrobia bacterium]|nr:dTMP kinase [Elusimicrobiota bacterium]